MPTKPCTQLRSVEGIQYELVRKKVKQLHLRVRSNGTVMVSIPLTASLEQADRFVLQNAQWIRDTFSPLLVEMEGGAIAQVCLRNGVPVGNDYIREVEKYETEVTSKR